MPEWGDSTDWQYWVIDTVKRYEEEMGYQAHPIGMTMQFPVADQTKVNEPLFASRAEWISPGFEEPDYFPGQPRAPGLVRRPAGRGREEGRDRPTRTTSRRAEGTRSGCGRRSSGATIRS